jgi:hypothetical protein
MKAKYVRCYKKADGNGGVRTVFVYEVNGSADQLAKYKISQGDHFVEDDDSGKALFFTVDFMGDNAELIITAKNNVVQNTEEYDKQASLVAQAGGDLGAEIAKIAAQRLMGVTPVAETAPVAAPVPAPEA